MRTFLAMAAVLALASDSLGQRGISPKRLVVDVVSVKRGPRLCGLLLAQARDGTVTLAVERAWLKRHHRRYYDEVARGEKAISTAGFGAYKARLQSWIEDRSADKNLVFFLQQEEKRLQDVERNRRESAGKDKQFVLIEIPGEQVRSQFRQPESRRQLARLAWKHRVRGVTTRNASALRRELKKMDLAVEGPVDLGERLPSPPANDEQWSVRVALVEFRLRKKLTFQGEGDYLAETGEGAAEVDLNDLIKQILGQQIAAQLALTDVLGKATDAGKKKVSWRKKAIKKAEYEGVRGFLVSRLQRQFTRTRTGFDFPKQATVELSFFSKMPDGSWRVVWQHREARAATKVDPTRMKEIAAAPRIKQVLDGLKKLGLANNKLVVDRLLAFGAATMDAQQAANRVFGRYLLQHSRRVDGPPILIASSRSR